MSVDEIRELQHDRDSFLKMARMYQGAVIKIASVVIGRADQRDVSLADALQVIRSVEAVVKGVGFTHPIFRVKPHK